MKFSLLLVALVAFSVSAHADGNQTAAAKVERSYQYACVPGSVERLSNPDSVEKDRAQKEGLLAFLDDPVPALTQLEKMAKSDSDSKNRAGAQMGIALLCSIAGMLNPEIEKRGCVDEAGKKHSAAKAVAECDALFKRLKGPGLLDDLGNGPEYE